MIGCGATGSLAPDVMANADCLISAQVESAYGALLAPGGAFVSALTIALTIYVAVIGYRLILGHSGLSLGEMVPHFIKMGIVLALATRWPTYQALVFNLLFHGPDQLAAPILRQVTGNAADQGDVLAAVQAMFDRLTSYAGAAWSQHTAAPPPQGAVTAPSVPPLPLQLGAPQFVAMLLWGSALTMLAVSLGVLLVVRIILALLLVIGPIFIALAMFASTRGLFEGWLRMAVKFALVPLFTLPLTAALIAVLIPFATELGDGPVASVRDGPVLAITLIVLVFAAVMLQATRLSADIARGIRLPRRRPAPVSPVVTATAVAGPPVMQPVASRAQIVVQSLGGNRGGGFAAGMAAPEAMLATRRITAAVSSGGVLPDSSGRLGQGYRRLAIGTPAPAVARKGR
jgi:type IV secretion system protein VirB6